MTYNIHPIFVHFPIALLFIYSIIKILPLEKWLPRVAWKDIERVTLLVGVFGAFAALATGESAQHLTHPNRALVHAHSFFATLATWLYGALLAGEILFFVNSILARKIPASKISTQLINLFSMLEKFLCHKIFSKVIAILALLAITVTGLLGGVIVFGVTADPFSQIVLNILNIQL